MYNMTREEYEEKQEGLKIRSGMEGLRKWYNEETELANAIISQFQLKVGMRFISTIKNKPFEIIKISEKGPLELVCWAISKSGEYFGKTKMITAYDFFEKPPRVIPKRKLERGTSTYFDTPEPTNVYVMKDESNGFYKIGKSINPSIRESTLQAEKPSVTLIFSYSATSKHERELHKMFAEKRLRGEWFRLNQDDLSQIKTYLENEIIKRLGATQ